MKKILSIVLALTMVLALASCGGNTTTTSSVDTPVSSEEATSSVDTTAGGDEALAVLNNIYAQYPDDYKVFGGGDEANMNWKCRICRGLPSSCLLRRHRRILYSLRNIEHRCC